VTQKAADLLMQLHTSVDFGMEDKVPIFED
jgi:hypothetical protein